MRQTRKLSLKRETLTQLTTHEMAAVAGGSHACATDGCTDRVTHGASFEVQCPTLPVNQCIDNLTYKAICG